MTWRKPESDFSDKLLAMIVWLRHLLGWIVSAFRAREDLVLENLALRHQLLALHALRPRHQFPALHKLFWVALRTCWSGWKKPLVLVTPRSVVNWHRAGFRLYWRWVSRAGQIGGRKRVSKDIRALIFRMVAENPTRGAVATENFVRSENTEVPVSREIMVATTMTSLFVALFALLYRCA